MEPISSSTPSGTNPTAALSSAVLYDPFRKLPEMPRIFTRG